LTGGAAREEPMNEETRSGSVRHKLRTWSAMAGAVLLGAAALAGTAAQTPEASPTAGVPAHPTGATPDLEITDASIRYVADLDLLVFDVDVAGTAGGTTPEPFGELDGAPVLGYVVPTNLPPGAVGFELEEGIMALAVTAHPDFDDTPLRDETADGDYANDGGLWHTHWVLVGPDERVPGGLAVIGVAETEVSEVLPPTAPGLPIALDSPGFPVQLDGATLQVVVPAPRVGGESAFNFDAASAYLQVNTSDPDRPLLGVYDVYGVLSGDLSLPFSVEAE
jgi:hypothetical protein